MIIEKANSSILYKLRNSNDSLLFRGQTDSRYILVPSIYRFILQECEILRKSIPNLKSILDHFFLKNFRCLMNREPGYEWFSKTIKGRDQDINIWIFLQHLGISTPYIDWTENFIIALLFALFSLKNFKKLNLDSYENLKEYSIKKECSILIFLDDPTLKEIVRIDPKKLEISHNRIIFQKGQLTVNMKNFEMPQKNFIKYDIDSSIGLKFFFEMVRLNNQEKNILQTVISDFQSEEKIDIKSDLMDFRDKVYEIIRKMAKLETIHSNNLSLALAEIDLVPSQKNPGQCDPTQLIMLGQQ